jgi:elongation factor G
MAVREAIHRAHPILLEPIMKVEVVIPEEYLGDVLGDLNSRRARIEGMEKRANTQIIRAHVPLAEMFGYATQLRSLTQGRGSFTMQFEKYEPVPAGITRNIIEQVQGESTEVAS